VAVESFGQIAPAVTFKTFDGIEGLDAYTVRKLIIPA
jgi:hypothetical protein